MTSVRHCLFAFFLSIRFFAVPCLVAGGERPNVVVLITDDQGWADIGYNNEKVYTPNLDGLARGGAIFEQHYVMPQCTPTRVALMTGRYPGRFGRAALTANNNPVFPKGTPTLPKMFQDAGYKTFMSGKWHLGSTPKHGPNHFGFDESHGSLTGAVGMYDHRYKAKRGSAHDNTWHRNHETIPGLENGRHVTDLSGDEAVNFIRRVGDMKAETPFFLYVPFHAPHTPLDERGEFVEQPTIPDPENPKRWINEDRIRWFNDSEGKIQSEPSRDKRLLLAAVHHVDYVVGRVVAALEETGVRENTLILFSSDNGPWINDGGGGYPDHIPLKNYNQPDDLRGRKLDVWEGGINVAGFMNWPGRIKPQKVEEYVHIIDWFPTLAGVLGIDPAPAIAWDGLDLGPRLFEKTPLPERDLYWIWGQRTDRWALRFGDWKIVSYKKAEPELKDWKLFDLKEDPSEKKDVASKHPEVVERLVGRFLAQRKGDVIK